MRSIVNFVLNVIISVIISYSTSSMRVESVFSSSMIPVDSAHDVHDPTAEQADDDDELSECSDLEAQFNLSMQIQIASMLSFAYIWSLGAFVPFRYICNKESVTYTCNCTCTSSNYTKYMYMSIPD